MKNFYFVWTPLLLSAAVGVNADTIGGNGALQTWSAGVLSTPSGTPYWNNLSGDGPTNNIGWCVAGGGNCSIANAPGAAPYYGNSNGTAATNMFFNSTGDPVTASLLGVFSSQNGAPNGTDYFGWYALNSNNTLGTMAQLLSSTASIGSSASFSPTGQYGFYFENVQGAGANQADYYWFTNSSFDYAAGTGSSDGLQHFATFVDGSGFLLGMEDTNGAKSDGDFNDLIVDVQNGVGSGASAPEPVTFALIGTGLVLSGLVSRRKNR